MNNNPLIMQQLLNKIQSQFSEQATDPEAFLRERLALYVGSPGSIDNPNLKVNPGTRDIRNMADDRYFSDIINGVDSGEAYRKRNNFIQDYNNALQLYRDASAEGPTGFAAPIGQYGMGNIDLYNRPVIKNSDGSISTVRSMSFNDGRNEVLIPTVSATGIMTPQEAINRYRQTGEYLGKFSTPEEANEYAQRLHKEQANLYK